MKVSHDGHVACVGSVCEWWPARLVPVSSGPPPPRTAPLVTVMRPSDGVQSSQGDLSLSIKTIVVQHPGQKTTHKTGDETQFKICP